MGVAAAAALILRAMEGEKQDPDKLQEEQAKQQREASEE